MLVTERMPSTPKRGFDGLNLVVEPVEQPELAVLMTDAARPMSPLISLSSLSMSGSSLRDSCTMATTMRGQGGMTMLPRMFEISSVLGGLPFAALGSDMGCAFDEKCRPAHRNPWV